MPRRTEDSAFLRRALLLSLLSASVLPKAVTDTPLLYRKVLQARAGFRLSLQHRIFHACDFKRIADVLYYVSLCEKIKALKHHSDVLSCFKKLFCFKTSQLLAVNYYLSRGRALKVIYTADERAFAGSRKSDDAEYLSVVYCYVDVFYRSNAAF